jgi:hypothetical protein
MLSSFAPVSPVAPAVLMALSILKLFFLYYYLYRGTRVTRAIGYITRFVYTQIAPLFRALQGLFMNLKYYS